MKYFLVVLFIFALYSPTESLSLKNIGKSAVDVAKGVVEKIPDAIPSFDTLLQGSKNLIVAYPFEKVAYLVPIFFEFISHFDPFASNVTNFSSFLQIYSAINLLCK